MNLENELWRALRNDVQREENHDEDVLRKLQKTQYALAGAAIVAFAGLCVWKFCSGARGAK